MKKKLFILVSIFIFILHGYCEKTMSDVVLITSLQIPRGVALGDERGSFSPIFMTKDNKIYMPLCYQKAIQVYNSKFEPIQILETKNTQDLFFPMWNNFTGALYGQLNGCMVVIKNDNVFPLAVEASRIISNGIFYNLIINEHLGKILEGFLLPETPDGEITRLSSEEVFAFIDEHGKDYDLKIEDGSILYRDIPWYHTGFYKKWDRNFGPYNAMDKDANIYDIEEVLNSKGQQLETFSLWDPGFDQVFYDYEGNIYILRRLKIYYLGRDWGYPDARSGTLKTNTAVYLHPGSTELVIGQAEAGAITVFEQTEATETVNGKTAPWYKVKTAAGLVGWVHGAGVVYNIVPESPLKVFRK